MSPRAQARLAALGAVVLGLLAAGAWVGGHHRWDGRVVLTLSNDHGLHHGDWVAAVPLGLAAALARWCWRQGRGGGNAGEPTGGRR